MANESSSKRVVEVVLKVVDQAGKAIQSASASLKKLSGEQKKAAAASKQYDNANKKTADSVNKLSQSENKAATSTKKLASESKKAKKDVKALGDESKKTGKEVAGMGNDAMGGIGSMIADIGTLVSTLGTIAAPVTVFAKFERSMAEVGAVANATEGQLDKLSRKAMELGSTTEYSASQVASGMKYLSMAGLSVEQTYQSINGVLDLALAGNMDLGQAADIATNILTGFGKSASELSAVNDVLVTAFTSTNSTLEELGTALAYVGPIASGLGAEFTDLVAAVGLLHNAGLKGSMAGTALRSVLSTLFNPTKDEADQLKVLSDRIGGVGLQLTNSEGNFVGFGGVLEQLEQAGISATEALSLFGDRAGPGVAALLSQGSKALTDMSAKFQDSEGRAHALAQSMSQNLVGAAKSLMSAMEGLMIRIGDKLAPTIEKMTRSVTDFVTNLNRWIDANPKLASGIIKVTGAILGMVAAMKALKIASMAMTLLKPSIFKKAGVEGGANMAGGIASGLKNGIKKFLPTLAGFFSGGGWISKGIKALKGVLATSLTGLGSFFSTSLSTMFAAGGATAVGAFATSVVGGIGAFFAGFKIGQLIEPFVSQIELAFTNLNIGELLQKSIAVADYAFTAFSGAFQDHFYYLPKVALTKMYATFVEWAGNIVRVVEKIPGIGKVLGWADEKAGLTKTLDALKASSSEMARSAVNDRNNMLQATKGNLNIITDVMDGINKEADAREAAYQKEKDIAAKKKAMYDEIENINKEFDPGIEKASAEVKRLQKQFLGLSQTVRTTAESARGSLAGIGEGLSATIENLFADVDIDSSVKSWSDSLKQLNRDYESDVLDLTDKIRTAENGIGDARVEAVKSASEQSIALLEEQTQRQIDLEKAAHTSFAKNAAGQEHDEKKLADAITKLSAEGAKAKQSVYTKASKVIQAEIDRSIKKERELADELKSLKDTLKDALEGIQSDEADLRRSLMKPAQAYKDALKEVRDVMAAGDSLASAGKTKEAIAKWREAASLAKSAASEVKDGDKVIVSKAKATAQALQTMERAETKIKKAGQSAIAETEKKLAAQKQHTDAVVGDLDTVENKLRALDTLSKEGLTVAIKLDTESFDRDLQKILDTKDQTITVGVRLDAAQDQLSDLQLGKADALKGLEDKFGDLTKNSKDFEQSVKSTMGALKEPIESVNTSLETTVDKFNEAGTAAAQLTEWQPGDIINNDNIESAIEKLREAKETATSLTEEKVEIPVTATFDEGSLPEDVKNSVEKGAENTEIVPTIDEKALTQGIAQAVEESVGDIEDSISGIEVDSPSIVLTDETKEFQSSLVDIEKLLGVIDSYGEITLKVTQDLDEEKLKRLQEFTEELIMFPKPLKINIKVESDDEDAKETAGYFDSIKDKLVTLSLVVKGLDAIKKAKAVIDSVKSKTVTITTVHRSVTKKAGGGSVDPEEYADGGDVFRKLPSPYISRGGGTKDDVPAMLMKGEFVIKKSAVAKYGKDFLYLLNQGMLKMDPAPNMYAAGGIVSHAAGKLSDMGSLAKRKIELMVNPGTPLTHEGVTYHINAPSFHQHIDGKAAQISTPQGKANATRLLNKFSAIVPGMASGGGTDLLAQFNDEKNIITAQYNEDIRFAKETGDDEKQYILEMEQLQLEELAVTLAATLDQIRLEYEEALLELDTSRDEEVAQREEEKIKSQTEYRSESVEIEGDRSKTEREFIRESRDLKNQLEAAKRRSTLVNKQQNAWWGSFYSYGPNIRNAAKQKVQDLSGKLADVSVKQQVEEDKYETQQEVADFQYKQEVAQANKGIERAESKHDRSVALEQNKFETYENIAVAKNEVAESRVRKESQFEYNKAERETLHTVNKLELELQLELLRLRQQYDEMIADAKQTTEGTSPQSKPTSQQLGIKYWLNSGGPVGYPVGKKRREDSVLAMLTPGEFVINEDAVRHYGADYIAALNNREVDPNYNDFPSFLSKPKMVRTPTTIDGVTYHVNAPSFHDNLASKAISITQPEGQRASKNMIKIFSDAVPHLAEGGEVDDAAKKLAYESELVTTEYNEKIDDAKARGQNDLAYILENEQIQLAMIANELQYTLEDLAAEREYALQEAQFEHDSALLENELEEQEALFQLEQDRMDAEMAFREGVAEQQAAIEEAKQAKKVADQEYGQAMAQYNRDMRNYNKSQSGADVTAEARRRKKQFDFDHFFQSNLPDLNYWIEKVKAERAANPQQTVSRPSLPSNENRGQYDAQINEAKRRIPALQKHYQGLVQLYALKDTQIKAKRIREDEFTERRLVHDNLVAVQTHEIESTKATRSAEQESKKVTKEAEAETVARTQEMEHEIKIFEVELAKAIFELKRKYSTEGIGAGVKHWLNSGGSVPMEPGAIRGKDSVRAMLTPGEFVIREDVVKKFGAGFFRKLNNFQLPRLGFADGGLVPGGAISDAVGSETNLGSLNLIVGGQSHPVKSDMAVAKSLIKEFKKMGMSIV